MNTSLKTAVIEQLGLSYMEAVDLSQTMHDIANHGIDGGFTGFIYYSDTIEFAEDNKADILQLARDMADDFGLDGAYSLIASFGCLGDSYTADSVADAVNDPDHEDYTQVMNALSWFAAEEVAREITGE